MRILNRTRVKWCVGRKERPQMTSMNERECYNGKRSAADDTEKPLNLSGRVALSLSLSLKRTVSHVSF